jgi:uncharacterized membrane protein
VSNEDDYKRSFGLGSPPDKEKARRALDHALDIRKFEIGLYWQRTAYFWALIAAAFGGYFAILSAEHLDDKEYLSFILSCIGALFTWSWFLVNPGSKLWQENWENHVDMLEDEVTGPLYKTLLYRPEADSVKEVVGMFFTGPAFISVSKVNQLVSVFTLCIWAVLAIHALPEFSLTSRVSIKHVVVGAITLSFAWLMYRYGKTSLDAQVHVKMRRSTRIR